MIVPPRIFNFITDKKLQEFETCLKCSPHKKKRGSLCYCGAENKWTLNASCEVTKNPANICLNKNIVKRWQGRYTSCQDFVLHIIVDSRKRGVVTRESSKILLAMINV